jgi:PAT family beta-lactamase induction signal transducer AmpG
MTTLWPIIGGLGFVGLTTASYSGMISTVGLVMAIVSIGIGSVVTVWLGARLSSVLIHVTYALMALFVLYGQSIWLTYAAFVALSCLWSMHDVLTSIFTNPLRMQLSDPKVAATQFTIYNSLSNLPVSFGAITVFAWLGGTGNLDGLLWTVAGLMLLGAALFAWMEAGARSRGAAASAPDTMPAEPVFAPRVD